MPVRSVYEAELLVKINIDAIKTQLKAVEAQVSASVAQMSRALTGLGSIQTGPKGGLSGLDIVDTRKLSAKVQAQMRELAKEGVQGFEEAFDEIARSIGTTTASLTAALKKVNVDAKVIWEEFRKTGTSEAEKLSDELVGHSIITDMVNSIAHKLASLPDLNRPVVQDLIKQFDDLDRKAQTLDLENPATQATSAFGRLKDELQGLQRATGVTFEFTSLRTAANEIKTVVASIPSDMKAIFGQISADVGASLAPAVAKVKELGSTAKGAVGEIGQSLGNEFSKARSIVVEKVTDINTTIASRFAGVKQVFIEVGDTLGNVFGKFSPVLSSVGSAITAFGSKFTQAFQGTKAAVKLPEPEIINLRQLIAGVEVEISNMPRKANEGFNDLKRQFQELRSDALAVQHQLEDVNRQISSGTSAGADTSALNATRIGLEANASAINTSIKTVQTSLQTLRQEKLTEIKTEFQSAGAEADKLATTFGNRFQTIRTAMTFASETGGNKLLALRLAFFGLGNSTNIVGKLLDRFTGGLDDVGKAEGKLAAISAKTAEAFATQATSIKKQIDSLKEFAAAGGVSAKVIDDLDRRVSGVGKSFEQMATTVAEGGKVTPQALARIRLEAKLAGVELEQLKKSGKITTPEGIAALKELQERINELPNGTRLLAATMEKAAAGIEKAKVKQQELGTTTAKTSNIFQRINIDFRNFFNFVIHGSTNVNNLTSSIKDAGHAADTAKGSFLGAFAGVAAGIPVGQIFADLGRTLVGLSGQIIKTSAEVQEMVNKFEVVFKEDGPIGQGVPLVQRVREELGLMASNFRRSVFDLEGQAAKFQDTFVPLGFAKEDAAKLSVALVALTQDASSLYNVSTDEAAERFASTLVGNTENMRAFSTVINEATTDQALLDLGLNVTSQSANVQQKTLAYLTQIFHGVEAAQGDLMNTQDSFTNQQRALEATFKDLQVAIGSQLLPVLAPLLGAFTAFVSSVGPAVISTMTNIAAAITPFALALSDALSTGNLTPLFNGFIDGISSGVNAALDFLNSFIPNAFTWGENFIIEIANGIYDAAETYIMEAVQYVGDIIASFLEPGSPPEQGPLSEIDKWAKGLISVFSSSFTAADFRFVDQALAPIKDAFKEIGGEVGFEGFKNVREQFVNITDELNRTGNINESAFQGIVDSLGEGNKELGQFLRLQLKVQQADKKVADIRNQITAAQSAGFVSKELQDRLATAEQEAAQAKENLDLQQEFLKFNKLSLDEFTQASSVAASAAGKAASAGSAAVKENVNKQLEFVKTGFDKEKALLDDKLRRGTISQEEYYKDLIKLQEKYVDDSQRLLDDPSLTEAEKKAIAAGLDAQVEALKANQVKLETLQEANREANRKNVDKQLEFIEAGYDEEKRLLQAKLDEGSINQKEYLEGLIKLEEKYIDASHRKGLTAGLEQHVTLLQDLKDQLANAKVKGSDVLPSIDDLLSGYLSKSGALSSPLAGKVANIGQGLQVAFSGALERLSFGGGGAGLVQGLLGGLKNIGTNIFNALKPQLEAAFKKIQDFITPENFGILAVIVGWGATLLASPITKTLSRAIGPVVAAFGELGGVAGVLKVLAHNAAKFSIIGAIVVGLIENWDEILPELIQVFEGLKATLGRFIETLQRVWDTLKKSEQFQEGIAKIGAAFGRLVTSISLMGVLIKKGLKVAILGPVIFIAEKIGEIGQRFVEISGGPEKFAALVSGAVGGLGDILDRISISIYDIVNAVSSGDFAAIPDIIKNTFVGLDFDAILEPFKELGSNLGKAITEEFDAFFDQPQFAGIKKFFADLQQAFTDFMQEGRLGGELAQLFGTIKDNIGATLLVITPLIPLFLNFTATGSKLLPFLGTVGTLLKTWVPIIGIVITVVRHFGELWPAIEMALAGAVEAINGVIEIVGGLFKLFDDKTRAEGIREIGQGISDLYSGLVATISGLGETIVNTFLAMIGDISGGIADLLEATGNDKLAAPFRAFEQVLTTVRLTISGWVDEAIGIMAGLQDQFLQIWGLIFGDLQGTFDKLKILIPQIVGDMVAGIIAWFQDLYDQAFGNSIFPDLVNGIMGLFEWLRDNIGPVITTFVSNITTEALTLATQVPTWISDWVQQAVDFVTTNGPLWATQIQTGIESLLDQTTAYMGTIIAPKAAELFDQIKTWVQIAVDYLGENVPVWAGQAGQFIGSLLSQAATHVGTLIAQAATDLYAKFNDWFEQTFQKTDENASTLGYRIGFIIGNFIRAGIDFFFVTIPEQVTKFFTGIQNIFTGGIGEFENGSPDLATRMGELVGVVIGGVFVFFTQMLPGWIVQLNDKIGEFIHSIPTWINENGPTIAENIWGGIESAIQSVFDLFSGGLPGLISNLSSLFSDLLKGAVEAATAGFPDPLKKLLGLDKAGDVAQEAVNTASQFDSAFSGVGSSISTPVEQGTEESKGFFQGLYDAVIGNSIIPDMVTQIGLQFQFMATGFGLVNTQMLGIQTVTSQAMVTTNLAMTTQMGVNWTVLLTNVSLLITTFLTTTVTAWQEAFDALNAKSQEVLDAIIAKINDLIAVLVGDESSVVSAADEAAQALAGMFNKNTESKLNALIEKLKEVVKILERVEVVAKSAAAATRSAGEPADGGGGGSPGFQGGAYRILRGGQAILHPDETVLNAPVADAFRSFISALTLHGIGDFKPTGFTGPQAANSLGGGSSQTTNNTGGFVNVTANFPNVKSANEADGIVDALNDLIGKSRNLALVSRG